MNAQIETVRDLIAALGGPPAVAPATSVDQNTAVYWGRRERIPVEHWDSIIRLAADVEPPVVVDHALLIRICRARKPRAAVA